MAICTICGAVMNELDIRKHKCVSEDVPMEGVVKRVLSTAVNVEEI